MDTREQGMQQRWFSLFIILAIAVNGSGLCIPILGPDAAVYASIAKTMVQRHNYLELVVQGHDWLDKPHFPFWLTALSFRLFGVHTWAYKLPAILCLLMGAWDTYLFAKQFYTPQVALWSVLILLNLLYLALLTPVASPHPLLYQSLPTSIHDRHAMGRRRNDDTHVGTAARGIVA